MYEFLHFHSGIFLHFYTNIYKERIEIVKYCIEHQKNNAETAQEYPEQSRFSAVLEGFKTHLRNSERNLMMLI